MVRAAARLLLDLNFTPVLAELICAAVDLDVPVLDLAGNGRAAAHVRWHSQQGPDEITNALALCALHHTLFNLGVLGITEDRLIRVSSLYVARNEAGLAVDALAGKPLLIPRPHQPTVDVIHISWHDNQVFEI